MNILTRIADGFVQAFGITAPAESQRKTATLFISVLLLGILAAFFCSAALLAWHFLH